MSRESGYAEVNGTRLYYEAAGSGRVLVLIHGFTLDTRMWEDQFEAFAKHYRVVRYDIRGYGRSALLAKGEVYSHADDLRGLLDHLGVTRAHVLGLSMGGYVAINFSLEYPERIMSLIPVDASLGGFRFSEEFSAFLGTLSSKAKQEDVEASKKLFLNSGLFKPAYENPAVAERLEEMVSGYSGWHWLNTDPQIMPDIPATNRLDRIVVPALVIVGERDLQDSRGIANDIERGIPKAIKVVLTGVGHIANMEAPQRFNEMVLDFLAEI